MIASIIVTVMLPIYALMPATAVTAKEVYHDSVVHMLNALNTAELENFAEPDPLLHKQQMHKAWVEFAQEVQDSADNADVSSAYVDNAEVCSALRENIWSWKPLYWNLSATAHCHY